MVCDFGGGTFEVAVLEKREDGGFKIKSKAWLSSWSGSSLDRRVALWVARRLEGEGRGLDLELESSGFSLLQTMVEEARIALLKGKSYRLRSEGVSSDSQIRFPQLDIRIPSDVLSVADIVDATVELCRRALRRVNRDGRALDEVLVTGGCSRIPGIEEQLKKVFGVEVRSLDPDFSVTIGAAIKARQLTVAAIGPQLDLHKPTEVQDARVRSAPNS